MGRHRPCQLPTFSSRWAATEQPSNSRVKRSTTPAERAGRPCVFQHEKSGRPSESGRLKRVTGACVVITCPGADLAEIPAQSLERRPLHVDLMCGPIAQAAKDRNGRAPALDRVLEQERRD
jgi:hypothetical protein